MSRKFFGFIVFFGSFTVFLLTLSPLIDAGDSGELVAAGFVLGIPHPPGYPLYSLIAKAFSFFPFGNVAYRANILSALMMALSALFVYKTAAVVKGPEESPAGASGAAAVALALAFSGVFWGQATSSEVDPLQIALSLAALYAILSARRKADFRLVFLSSFLFGLSVTAHYAGLLFLPGFVFMLFYNPPRGVAVRDLAVSLFFFMLGLSVFLYLPLRAHAGALVNWGDPEFFKTFIAHVSRASYGDLAGFSLASFLKQGMARLRVSGIAVAIAAIVLLAVAGMMAGRRLSGASRYVPAAVAVITLAYLTKLSFSGITGEKIYYLMNFAQMNMWVPGLILSLIGAVFLFIRNRDGFYLLGLLLLCILVISIYRVPINGEFYLLPLIDRFFVLLLLAAGLFAVAGATEALTWLQGKGMPGYLLACASISLFALPAWFLTDNYEKNDRSQYFYAFDYSNSILNGMEQDAIYLTDGDNQPFLAAYMKFIEKRRPDIDFFEATGFIFNDYKKAEKMSLAGNRPVYCTSEEGAGGFEGIQLVQSGMVSRFPFSYAKIYNPWKYYTIREAGSRVESADYATREVLVNYRYYKGKEYMRRGENEAALAEFYEALRIGPDFPWIVFNVAGILRDEYNRTDYALELFYLVERMTPAVPEVYFEKGITYYLLKNYEEARENFKRALTLKPDMSQAYRGLAAIHEETGKREEAAEAWEKFLIYCSEDERAFAKGNIQRLKGFKTD